VLPVFAGSAGTLPAVFGSLPNTIFVGKLPTNAGWQARSPERES
jgi:NCAIR mutase (PurE)-related protein